MAQNHVGSNIVLFALLLCCVDQFGSCHFFRVGDGNLEGATKQERPKHFTFGLVGLGRL